jgi:hypothetical protein
MRWAGARGQEGDADKAVFTKALCDNGGFDLRLDKNAPSDWNKHILFSVILQDIGAGSRARLILNQ